MCLLQTARADWQNHRHYLAAQTPADLAAKAALPLPAAVPASEPLFAASRWHNPHAILPTRPTAADIASLYSTDMSCWKAQDLELTRGSLASFSGSSTSSEHCLGRIPAGVAPPQGPPTMPVTSQSPKTMFNIPNLSTPMTADWGCTRPVQSQQQQPRSHQQQQSAEAMPASFATQQQCWSTPGHSLITPQHFPSSLKQACLAAQQQHELLYGRPQPTLVAPQQSPTSSYMTFQQLQLLRPRLGGTNNRLLDTNHHVSSGHQSCILRNGIAAANHPSGLRLGQSGGTLLSGQQLNYEANIGPQHTSYAHSAALRMAAEQACSPATAVHCQAQLTQNRQVSQVPTTGDFNRHAQHPLLQLPLDSQLKDVSHLEATVDACRTMRWGSVAAI